MKTLIQLLVASTIFFIVEVVLYSVTIYLLPSIFEPSNLSIISVSAFISAFGILAFIGTILLLNTDPVDKLMNMIEED